MTKKGICIFVLILLTLLLREGECNVIGIQDPYFISDILKPGQKSRYINERSNHWLGRPVWQLVKMPEFNIQCTRYPWGFQAAKLSKTRDRVYQKEIKAVQSVVYNLVVMAVTASMKTGPQKKGKIRIVWNEQTSEHPVLGMPYIISKPVLGKSINTLEMVWVLQESDQVEILLTGVFLELTDGEKYYSPLESATPLPSKVGQGVQDPNFNSKLVPRGQKFTILQLSEMKPWENFHSIVLVRVGSYNAQWQKVKLLRKDEQGAMISGSSGRIFQTQIQIIPRKVFILKFYLSAVHGEKNPSAYLKIFWNDFYVKKCKAIQKVQECLAYLVTDSTMNNKLAFEWEDRQKEVKHMGSPVIFTNIIILGPKQKVIYVPKKLPDTLHKKEKPRQPASGDPFSSSGATASGHATSVLGNGVKDSTFMHTKLHQGETQRLVRDAFAPWENPYGLQLGVWIVHLNSFNADWARALPQAVQGAKLKVSQSKIYQANIKLAPIQHIILTLWASLTANKHTDMHCHQSLKITWNGVVHITVWKITLKVQQFKLRLETGQSLQNSLGITYEPRLNKERRHNEVLVSFVTIEEVSQQQAKGVKLGFVWKDSTWVRGQKPDFSGQKQVRFGK